MCVYIRYIHVVLNQSKCEHTLVFGTSDSNRINNFRFSQQWKVKNDNV